MIGRVSLKKSDELWSLMCVNQIKNKPIIKDASIVLLIFYIVPTQRKFESKTVAHLSSALCHQLYKWKIAAKFKSSLCENWIKDK